MSFSNLFTKLSDVEEKQPRKGNDIKVDQRSSRKRKSQQQPGSYVKRQCLRSFAADPTDVSPEEKPRASDAQRHWTRASKDPRAGVSGTQAYNHGNRAFRSNGNNKGNTNNRNNQKGQNKRRNEQENAQRYKNSNKDRRCKNVDFTQPRQRYMTQEFKDQHVLEVEGRMLCKYFILGRCTKGEECQLQHAEGSNDMIKDACKFYIAGTCYKGATCPYMHQSIPCKFFHKYGNCKSDNCRFSHDPLTDLTQKLLDDAMQRENELAELSRKAEEPVCQTSNKKQNTSEDIVIPAVRPTFYKSSELVAGDETVPPHNEAQSDDTEQHSAPQTDTNIEPEDAPASASLNQPGTVCYSVEAVLGPQLFKPVLYTASTNQKSALSSPKATTETTFNPVNAPYSVANVLRSQSGYTSQLCTPASTSHELKETPIRSTDDKYKASHQNLFKNPSSFHVTTASGSHDHLHKAPGSSTVNCDSNKTQEGATVTANLVLVADQITPGSKRKQKETPVELDKLLECGQDSERSTSSSSNSLPTKQETTTERSMKEQSSHGTRTVAGKRQDGPFGASVPPLGERNVSRFSSLFGNLNSDSDLTSSACSFSGKLHTPPDACSRQVHHKTKPSQFTETARKSANSTGCFNQETSHDLSQKPVSFSSNSKVKHKKEDVESAKTKSFQSLFTNISANVDEAFSDTASSSAKELQKSKCERQKATKTCQFTDNAQKMKKTASLNNNNQRLLHKKDCFQSKTPAKSFQSLFANLLPNSEATLSACKSFSDKPVVPSAQNVEKLNCGFNQATKAEQLPRSKIVRTNDTDANSNKRKAGLKGTNTEISNDCCLNPIAFSAKPDSKNKHDANTDKPKTSVKSFQSLFAAPLNKSTAENVSKKSPERLQSVDGKLSQSQTSERVGSQKTECVNVMAEESKHEPKEGTVSYKASARQSPQRQPHTGSVFKTLFQQLRPYEQQ